MWFTDSTWSRSAPRTQTVRLDRYWSKLSSVLVMCAAFGGTLGAAAEQARAQDRPNLILFLTDDQGIDAIEGADWPNLLNCRTPNIAAMAREGRVFNYTRVSPSCSPTRASLLTGRHPLRTGVMARLNGRNESRLVELADHEHTVAELLHEAGYYTILIDKWHVGGNPRSQGFDFYLPTDDIIHLDDPIAVGDEHITRTIEIAMTAVRERPDPSQPYALFFWSIDPHYRQDLSGREPWGWWKVARSLLPSGEDYYAPEIDSPQNRYRAVIEALDTEMGRMLHELGITDSQNRYRDESDTIVFYLSDNGSPDAVAANPGRSKGTLFEFGIRAPLCVFGERVPADGALLNELVSHVDFYDTIGDIIGTPINERGPHPRNGMSFADLIGWFQAQARRSYTLSNLGAAQPEDQRIALADTRYKLVARAGGEGLAPLWTEAFFDLTHDPMEQRNLLRRRMSRPQQIAFRTMRDQLTHQWSSSVGVPIIGVVDVPITDILAISSNDAQRTHILPLGLQNPGTPESIESRVLIRFDSAAIDRMLPEGTTIDDVVAAQVVTVFREDSREANETDTGPIRAFPMRFDWHSQPIRWADIANGHDANLELGMVDLPPHIISNLGHAGLSGIPISNGTPVSLAPSGELLSVVRGWHLDPAGNHGVVLMGDVVPDIGGDQSITVHNLAVLRLSMRIQ